MFRFLIDAKDEKEKAKVISQSMLFTFFNIIISSIIILIIGSIIHYDYTIYLIFFIIASILSTLAASIARGEGKFKIYSVFSFLSGALTILFNILFIVVFKMKEEGLFIAYILGNTLVSLWLMHKLKVNKYVNFKNYDKKQILDEYGLVEGKQTILFFGGGEFGLGKTKTIEIYEKVIFFITFTLQPLRFRRMQAEQVL